MAFYSYIFTANHKRFRDNLKVISQEKHISYPKMLLDSTFSIIKYGIGLTDYLNYEFYLKKKKERKEYAGIKIQNKFYELVSPSAYKTDYTIKPKFLSLFKEYTKRDFIVPDKNNYQEFQKFLSTHKSFMSKPYDGLGGEKVTKEYTKNIKNIKEYYNSCIENRIFLEELVIQNEEMNKLCKESCNTIRIMTFNNHGTPEILWAGLRIGNGINSVDNFHAGGMVSEIDLNTGKLISNAIDKDLNEYEFHPKSNVKFKGFEIPFFEEAKQLVLKASLKSNKILVVGWDVAISKDGPIIIEGNRRPGFDLVQVASKRGRMDIIRHVLNEL